MSEMEHIRGKLAPIPSELSIESQCELICDKHGWEKCDYCKTFVAVVEDDGCDMYIITDGMVYEVIDVNEVDAYNDLCIANKEPNGTINFEVKFYNGGASLNEMLEKAVSAAK